MYIYIYARLGEFIERWDINGRFIESFIQRPLCAAAADDGVTSHASTMLSLLRVAIEKCYDIFHEPQVSAVCVCGVRLEAFLRDIGSQDGD